MLCPSSSTKIKLYLLLAQTIGLLGEPILLAGNVPVLTANGSGGVEDTPGVNLLLKSIQLSVVGTEEGLAEIGLHNVALVAVATTAGGDVAKTAHPVLGDANVSGLDLLLGSGSAPAATDDGEHEGLTPRGVGRAGGDVGGSGGVDVVLDQRGALEDDSLEGGDGLVEESGVLPVGLGDETVSGTDGVGADALHGEVVLPGGVEVIVLKVLGLDAEAESGPLGEERLDHGLEVGQVHAGDQPGAHAPEVGTVAGGEESRVSVRLLGREVGEAAPVSLHGGPENGGGDVLLGGVQAPGKTGELGLGVDSDGHRGNDTPGGTTAATDSPEELAVGLVIGSDVATVGSDNVDAKDLVGTKTGDGAHGRVTTTGDVTTSDTDTAALAANGGVALLVGSLVQVRDLNTSTELEGGTLVATGGLVVLDELETLEVVGPDRQRTGTSVLAQEIVTSVADNEAQVKGASKVDSKLNLGHVGGLDGVEGKATNLASAVVGSVLGLASRALVERGHDRSRVLIALGCQSEVPVSVKVRQLTEYRSWSSCREGTGTSPHRSAHQRSKQLRGEQS